MADMRRRSPEPPPGAPQIQLKPGLAKETLRELAPLLAEEGIDVDNIDVPDPDTLQAAMKRAIERHNLTRFTPVGHARDLAVTTLRLVIEALADGDTTLAAAILEQIQPDSPDNTTATVAGCIGVALGLLDDWLTGSDPHAPAGLGQRVRLPAGHWLGERAATDILVLARKGRAFGSLDTLIARQGGEHVLYGSARGDFVGVGLGLPEHPAVESTRARAGRHLATEDPMPAHKDRACGRRARTARPPGLPVWECVAGGVGRQPRRGRAARLANLAGRGHDVDLRVGIVAGACEGDPLPVWRPGGRRVAGGVGRQPGHGRAVGVHHVDIGVAVAGGDRGSDARTQRSCMRASGSDCPSARATSPGMCRWRGWPSVASRSCTPCKPPRPLA